MHKKLDKKNNLKNNNTGMHYIHNLGTTKKMFLNVEPILKQW